MPTLAEDLDYLTSIGSWDWPENARETVLAGLGSDEAQVRLAALNLAADLMDDETAGALLGILGSDPDPEVRGRAAIVFGPALEQCRDDEDWEGPDFGGTLSDDLYARVERRLERLYRDAAAPKLVRRRALEAAVRSQRKWQEGAVRSAWASGDLDWKMTAVFCMGHLPGFDAEIEEALGGGGRLELEAVRAAGSRGIEKLGGEIYRRAESDRTDRELRHVAIEALPYVNPPGTRELLETYTQSGDRELAEEAEAALEELGIWELAASADFGNLVGLDFDDLDDLDDLDDE